MKRFLFILLGLLALTAMASSEKRPYVPPYTYEKYHITYQVRADGAYESTTEVQLKINTPQGIRTENGFNHYSSVSASPAQRGRV